MIRLVKTAPNIYFQQGEERGGGDIISDTIEQVFGGCLSVVIGFILFASAIIIRILDVLRV